MNTEFGMRHPRSAIRILLMGALALLVTTPAFCVADIIERQRWTLSTRQAQAYPGEPLVAVVECNAPGIAQANLASIRIIDANGVEVVPGYARSETESERVYAEMTESLHYRRWFVVNAWCSTVLAPGKYRLELGIHYSLAAEHKTVSLNDKSTFTTFGPEYAVGLSTPFEIIHMDRPNYESKLIAMAETGAQEKTSKLERDMAREMLAVAEGDEAVPYLLRIVNGSLDTYHARTALASLVKGGTVPAAQGLVAILSDNSYTIQWIRPDIVSAIYELRDHGDPRVLAVTDAVAQNNKRIRPPAPPTRLARQRREADGSSYLVIY